MAFPPSPAPLGATAPPPAQGGSLAQFAPPPPAYTTPSGIPALPRPHLTLSPTDLNLWWKRIKEDRARRELETPNWRQLATAYRPPNYGSDYTDLNSNIHFRNVHLKMSELWAQFPNLIPTPLDPLKGIPQLDPNGQPVVNPQTGQPQFAAPDDIVAIRRAVLNKELGRDGANVDLTIQQALFEVFMTAGIGPSKICYEADVKYTPVAPPTPVPGAILGLSQPPEPQPVVVNERFRWYHFSAEKLGIPSTYLSTDWDAAPYLFMEFEQPFTEQNKRAYNLPGTYLPSNTANNDRPLSAPADKSTANSQKVIKGVEVWLRAAEFDPNEADRDVFYRLVLIEGLTDRAAIYELSPYQDKGLDGRLTADSMRGNPIHPFCLRVAGDTAWVPSDAAFTNPLVNIENIQERQDAVIREANVPRFACPVSVLAAIDKAKDAGTGQGVGIDDAVILRFGEKIIIPFPHLERAQSDIQGREHNRQAITETLGLGANQGGAYNQTRKSATETAIVQQNVSARQQGERLMLLSRVMSGVTKFDTLIQRYKTDPGYVQLVGTTGLRRLMSYNKAHLAPRFAYDVHPDSQLSIDQTTRIKRAMDYAEFMAKSPVSNQVGIGHMMANAFGEDPAELLQPPPVPKPDPIALSLNLAGPNLAENLALPEVRAILQAHGIPLTPTPSPQVLIQAQRDAAAKAAPHEGGAPRVDMISKHHADQTGNQVGAPPLAGQPVQTPPQAVPKMVQ